MVFTLGFKPQGFKANHACAFEMGFGFSQGKGNALIDGEGFTKGFALLNIFPGFIQALTGEGETLQADKGTTEVKALHHLYKAFTFIAKPVFFINTDIVKKDGAPAHRSLANVVKTGAGNTRGIEIDKKG